MKNRIQESSPLSTKERIESLDIIRGIALFGILLVNMPLFQSPQLIADLYMMSPELSSSDQFLRMLLDVFVETKFFTIFSFLFGVGFYIFMERAVNKTDHFYRLYSRRLIVLAIFGFLHLCLLWYGDILLGYALAGFFLIFFYKRKQKTILLWLMSFSIVLIGLLVFGILGSTDSASIEQQISSIQEEGTVKVEEAIDIYQNGSYLEWLSYRFTNEVIPVLMNTPMNILTALFMFLIGLYAVKRGVFKGFPSHKPFIKRVWLISLLVSIPLSAGIILLHLKILDFDILNEQLIQSLLTISGLSLSFFYISTILLLLEREKWKRIFHPFSYVGRMALTNYITQTLIGVGLFTGLGMFGEVNIGLGILISIIVFPLQMILSYFWLKHFRFGPLEWLWRSLTYGEFQPMKKQV